MSHLLCWLLAERVKAGCGLFVDQDRARSSQVNTNESPNEMGNPYATPRSRLTSDDGSSLEWDPVTKQFAERLFRWWILAVLTSHLAYTIVNGALFYPVQILFGEEPIVHLRPSGLLVLALSYVVTFGMIGGMYPKLAVYLEGRKLSLQEFATKWKKNFQKGSRRPVVLTLLFAFIGLPFALSTFNVLLTTYYSSVTWIATVVAFPVVVVLCYPLCRIAIRRIFGILEALSSEDR